MITKMALPMKALEHFIIPRSKLDDCLMFKKDQAAYHLYKQEEAKKLLELVPSATKGVEGPLKVNQSSFSPFWKDVLTKKTILPKISKIKNVTVFTVFVILLV